MKKARLIQKELNRTFRGQGFYGLAALLPGPQGRLSEAALDPHPRERTVFPWRPAQEMRNAIGKLGFGEMISNGQCSKKKVVKDAGARHDIDDRASLCGSLNRLNRLQVDRNMRDETPQKSGQKRAVRGRGGYVLIFQGLHFG